MIAWRAQNFTAGPDESVGALLKKKARMAFAIRAFEFVLA
jgi:hypothetical protein